MILLQGHGLTRARKIPMETLSLSLSERASTASMTPADMTGIGIGSWMLDETDPGAGIVWRVKTITQAYATDTPTVQLEHVINTLRDVVLFGEHTPSMISGGDTCTAEQAVRYILARQSDWVLYQFDYSSVSNPYKFDGDTLFDALETVTNSLNDAWWEYDMSVYPFRLSIVQKSADVLTEMRAGRNIRTINRKVDKTGMYTRFYPIGENDLHITGDYVERNATTYGVISKVETDNSIGSEAELRRWAEERLRDHAEPTVSIDVDGVELVDATGESLDKMHLGAMCRIPLPEFNTTILERIVGLSYLDKVHQPESVRITLANNRTDITRIVADAIKSGATGKSGRTSAKRAKQDNAWFEDTNEHVAMCAKGIIGVDAQGNPNWTQLAQIIVDGTGIHQRVTETESGIATHRTAIEANARQISLEAETRGAADEELNSAILLTATNIRAEVSASNCQIYSYIEETACGIIARIHSQQRQIFTGPDTPGSGSGETVEEGALWIKYPKARTWEEAEDALTWVDNPDYNWNELGGSVVYEYNYNRVLQPTGNPKQQGYYEKNESGKYVLTDDTSVVTGKTYYALGWVEKLNEATLAEDAYVEDTAHGLHRTYAAVTIDAQKQVHAYRSEWQQTASMLWNDMEDKAQDLGSRIEQTTTQIRTEVHAAKSSLYSEIKQTATNIVQHVADEKKSIYSHIEQTASSINSSVVDLERGVYSNIRQTASEIRAHVKDVKEGLESTITQTASQIEARVESAEGDISSLTITASSIAARVSDAEGNISSIVETASEIRMDVANTKCELKASIQVQADRIGLVVEGTGSNAKIRPAEIVASINAQTGQSQVLLSGDQVSISGSTTLSGSMTIDSGALWIKKNLSVGSTTGSLVTVNNGTLNAPNIQVNSGGALKIVGTGSGEVYNLNASTLATMIKSASVSGNTLTLTPFSGSAITFSKATSLSGAWSSGTHTVTAKQTNSGTQTTVATHTTNNQIVFDGNGSANFSVKLQSREGSASTFTDRLSQYCYLVLSGSGRSQSVKAGANSDGSGSVGSISVSSVYDDGWAAAYAKVLVPSAGTGSSVTVKWPGSTQGNQGQRVYTLQNNGNNEVILTYPDGSDTITAAKLTHNKYSSGYSDGYTDGESAGSVIDYTEISAGNVTWDSGSISGMAQAGEISRPSARSYVKFSVTVRGVTRLFYIVIND